LITKAGIFRSDLIGANKFHSAISENKERSHILAICVNNKDPTLGLSALTKKWIRRKTFPMKTEYTSHTARALDRFIEHHIKLTDNSLSSHTFQTNKWNYC